MSNTQQKNEHTSIHLLYRVGRLLRQRNAEFMQRADVQLSPEQWGIMRQLALSGPLHLSELADPHLDDRPNITRLVDALVRHGLVQRTTDPADRRKKLVQMTPEGEALTSKMLEALKSAKSRIFRGIPPEDTAALLHTLQQLEHNLTTEMIDDDEI